jgi:hypothetical protein
MDLEFSNPKTIETAYKEKAFSGVNPSSYNISIV